MWELTKSFRFEAAHSLPGTTFGGSDVHGHSFRAEVIIRGAPDPKTGMIVDLGQVERALLAVKDSLDHKYLNQVEGLGPPTLENLARFIWDHVEGCGNVVRVSVFRDSCGEACSYTRPSDINGRSDEP